ncbi:MAG: filamentous hemagglutinin N-terminal domain-containing protein [Rhodanobacteraceae bacterium]|nr:MAG: filamentous hemagglutinin N-terminal domain-containing protein [Rhodanobacteraceae bacterium]
MKNVSLHKTTGSSTADVAWQRCLRRKALWTALSLALSMPMANAQTVPDGGTHTEVTAAPNGVPVVNIAAPNQAGVSDNTYQQFNVAHNGLIFNNSGKISDTQLAGYIGGNPNLGTNQSASLIINEVTSTAPSVLDGAMQVAGHAAQVVVANPNGISCNGCGFINAPRGTLTTGKPLFANDGSLSGFAVTGGTIAINGSGLPAGSTDQVDLLARAVAINAGVWAKRLDVVTGANRINFQTLTAQPLSASGATPGVALDVSALGGMYANAIFLVGTEAGLGVNNQGKIIAQNGDLTITNTGEVELAGKTTATGNIAITAAQALSNQGTLAAGGSVSLDGGNFTNQGVLYGSGAIALSANGAVNNSGQIEAQSGALTMQAQGAITGTSGSSVYAGGSINLSGASFANAGQLESEQGLTLKVTGDAVNSGNLSVDAGNFNLTAATIENTGKLAVAGSAALQASSSLASTGTLVANGAVALTAPSLTTAGTVQAGSTLGIRGGTLANAGKLYTLGGDWTAMLSGALDNQTGGAIYGSQNITLTAASLANAGGIEAGQGDAIALTGAFTNSGTLQSDQTDVTLQTGSLVNTGTLGVQRNLNLQTSGTVQNRGVLVSGHALNLAASTFDNQAAGRIQTGTNAAFSAATLDNEGVIDVKGNAILSGTALSNAAGAQWLAAGTLTFDQTGDVDNAGVLQSGGDLELEHAASLGNSGTLQSTAGDLTLATGTLDSTGALGAGGNAALTSGTSLASTGTLVANGAVTLAASNITTAGTLQAGSTLGIDGGTLTNAGKLYALGGAWTATLNGAFVNQDSGAIYGSQDVTLNAVSLVNAGVIEALQGDAITLTGAFTNTGTLQSDQTDVTLRAGSLANGGTLSAQHNLSLQTSGAAHNSGVLVSGQALNLAASTFDNQTAGRIQSGTSAAFSAATLANEGAVDAKGDATLKASSGLSSTGTLVAEGALGLSAPNLTTAGTVEAGGALTLSGGTLSNDGKLYALGGPWVATLDGAFTNQGSGDIYSSQGLSIDASSLSSSGGIEARLAVGISVGGAFSNSGTLQSDQSGVTVSAVSLTNTGTLSAAQSLQWQVAKAAQNSGALVSGRAMSLSSGSFDNQAGGQIQSGTDLALSAATLSNEGTVNAKGNAVLGGITLSNADTGQLIAAGVLTLDETGDVSNAGVLQAGNDVTLTQVASLTNAAGGTLYAGQDFNLTLSQALTNAGMLYATRTSTLSVGSVANTGTLRSGDSLSLASAGDVVSSGAIQAQQSVSLAGGAGFTNGGKLYAIGGGLTAQVAGVFDALAGSDVYSGQSIGVRAGSFANAGTFEATQNMNVTAQGSFGNSGDLQADHGDLVIAGNVLANQGMLSAAGATQLTSADSLDNSGKLVTGQTLAVTAAAFTNGGQAQSGGNATLEAANVTNSGRLQAGGNLGIEHNATLTNQTGGLLLAGGNVAADTSSLLTNAGVLQAGGSLAIDGAGAVSNAAGATLYGTQLVDLQIGGGLGNAGTLYGLQGVNLAAASLDNSGTLRSGAALDVATQGDAANAGTAYALGSVNWNVGGALANTGVLAADGNVTVQAASLVGNGTLAAGLQGNGSLGPTGDLGVTTIGNLVAGGRSLAAGNLALAGSTVDLSGSQTRARNIVLTASQGNVTNVGGDLAANGTVAIKTAASLVNGGATTAQGGKISAGTLVLQAAMLDNTYGSLIQTGTSDLNLDFTGAFDNANGVVATNARNLTVTAATLDNTAGTLEAAGNGTLDITTPGNLTNTAGKIAGNGALALQAGGTLGNAGGLLSVAGNVAATAASFDNVGGTLIGNNLGVSVAQALTNTDGGTLQAGGVLRLDAGSLDNTAGYIKVIDTQSLSFTITGALINGTYGFIGGNGAATVNAGSIDNAGQVYAGGTLDVTAQGPLNNDGGALQAQGSAAIASGGAMSNRGGRIEAGSDDAAASLSVRTASLDNTGGRIADTGAGASTFSVTQGAINEGGTLGGQGAVTVSAASLDNSQAGKLVAGQSLTLALGNLGNTGGDVYAAGDLDWNNANASLTNAQGSLQAGGNLSLDLASLDNTGGTIATAQNGTLSLGSFTDLGKIAAGQDLSLALGGNYTNTAGSALSANRNFTLDVAGDFRNATGATLQAVNQLTVNASNIDNAADATLNSADTVLVTPGALTNEGSIEGNAIALTAGSLTNTANIIGGDLTITAGSLTNGADLGTATGNNPYQSALIAGANGVDLYVSGTLLNRDATIFTLGSLTIGADARGSPSQAVTNLSGDIEAEGGIALNAHQFTNRRRVVDTATHVLTAAEQASNTSTTTSTFDWTTDPNAVAWCAQYATTTGANGHSVRCGPMGYYGDSGHETLTEQVQSVNRLASASAQSKLVGSGDITINGSVLNDASVIAAGNNLTINGQNGSHGGGATAGATVQNIAWVPTAVVQSTDVRAVDGDYEGSRWYSNRENGLPPLVYWTGITDKTIALNPSGGNGWITIAPGAGLAATMNAGNTVSVTAHTIDNTTVGSNGQPVQAAIGLGSNAAGAQVAGTGAGTVANASGDGGSVAGVALGSVPGQTSADSLGLAAAHTVDGTPAQGATSTQNLGLRGSSAPKVGTPTQTTVATSTAPASTPVPGSAAAGSETAPGTPQVVATLVGPHANVQLPQTGLYTVNVQPGSPFLVETNPQFTQYNNFISSNYLLQQLGLNPQQTEQRLGDGFYEQQLVLDQITDLTGRRYLADDTDALDQYRELMSNAVDVAKAFDLSVGVALTPAQMANLTQSIVWLVSVDVDGHKVLEPVVYLSAADANRFAASGATIAGKNVILTASGDLTNNGTIAASHDTELTASNLLNSGTIRAGNDLSVNAAQNILNGGTLQAGGNVSLVAGNDVLSGANVAQSLGTVNLSGLSTAFSPVALSNLTLPGAISAGGNLAISAGRDLSLDQAPVTVGANLSLAAGRDLTATAASIHAGDNVHLLAGRDLNLDAIARAGGTSTVAQSTLDTIHTVTGIDAGGALLAVAGRDLTSQGAQLSAGNLLTLGAGQDVSLNAVTDNVFTGSGQESGHTFETQTQSLDTVRGTSLTGAQGVSVSAGRNLTTEGAALESDNGAVDLVAGGALDLGAATEHDSNTYESVNQSGGLLDSKVTTVTDDVIATHAVGTVVSGNTVNLQSGRDMTLQGATVVGSNGVTLDSGGAINVLAATDTRQENYQKTVKTSGLLGGSGIGFTIGERTQQVTTGTGATALEGSLIGTIDGNVNIDAAKGYTQVASSLLSQHGNVNVLAGNINILAGQESEHQTTDTLFKQSGFTFAVGGGAVGALVSSAETEQHLSSTVSQAHDGRVNTMVAANAAIAGYQGYKAAQGLGQQFSHGASGAGLSVSLTYGQSESTSHSVTNATQAVGSTVSGQNVTLVSRGGNGTTGDLNVTGSSIHASQNVTLGALHDINVTAAQDTYDNTSTNHSSSGSVGVAATYGQGGVAFGVTVSAAVAHGDANTSSAQQVNSTVTAGKTLQFVSGNDTTLVGAVMQGNQVIGQVGGNLTLQSLQDTGQSHSSQTSVSASATFGYGASVSASFSHANSNSDYANVVQQTGIEAGDGGYQINVGGNTNLVGALLTSNQAAIDANRNTLTTGTLTASSIQNQSDASANSMGVGASFNTGATFGQNLDGDPGNNNYLAANGGKYGLTKAVIQNLMDGGSASTSANGQTVSALSPGHIVITDAAARGAQASESTSQLIAGLEANGRTVTNTAVAPPDVAAVQQSAQNEQTANNLMFNAGAWATNQGALKNALAAFQRVVGCKIASDGKHCTTQPLSGMYALTPGTTLDMFLNGIANNAEEAGNNAGDLAVLFTTPLSAGNTVVVNDYSPEVSGIGSLLAGLWNSIDSNHAQGALGTTAGAELAANLAGQIGQVNNSQGGNEPGMGITFNPMAHSDGTAQLMLSMEQNPGAWTNANGNTPTLVMLAEPSANAKTFQTIINAYGQNAGVVYSANGNDLVPRSKLIGDNPSTGGNLVGLFLAGPLTYGSEGIGLASSVVSGDTSIHSDIGYSATVTPVATDNGQIQYPWGPSGNPFVSGHVPVFKPAPDAPSDIPTSKADWWDGGDRTFATLLSTGASGSYLIAFPSISVAGSTAWAPNIALLTWPPSPAANLGAALAAMNGLPVNGGTSTSMPTFAPGSGQATNPPRAPAGTSSATNTTQQDVTPAQQRCLALTGGAQQCLQ